MTPGSSYTFATVAGTVTVIDPDGTGAIITSPPAQPDGMMINVKTDTFPSCGTVHGDGVNDDTAAILCLIQTNRTATNVYYGRYPKQFYFPMGTYLVSASLTFDGCCETWFGDGPSKTIFRLAPSVAAYASASTPADFIYFQGSLGNEGFSEYFENIGIEIGPGNPGVRALHFIGNNFDAVKNVNIWSDDSTGYCGLCMVTAWPGATMVKNLGVYGFGYGAYFGAHNEYNVVMEGITLENQSVQGLNSNAITISARNLFCQNSVTCFQIGAANGVVIGGTALGGSSTNSAFISTSNGTLYARTLASSGYQYTLNDQVGGITFTGPVAEHWTGTAQTLFSTTKPALLAIEETPEPNDGGSSGWTALGNNVNDWNTNLQACTSSAYYVPVVHNYHLGTVDTTQDVKYTGVYTTTAGNPVAISVPDCVNHIMLDSFQLNPSTAHLEITVAGTSNTPLIIDHAAAGIVHIHHTGSRPIVLKDINATYDCANGAGTVFFEDEQPNLTNFCNGQKIYARLYDNEANGTQFRATGASVSSMVATFTGVTVYGANVGPLSVGTNVYFQNFAPATIPGPGAFNNLSGQVTSINGTTVTVALNSPTADFAATPTTDGYLFITDVPKTTCTGCTLWVLGYKTEKSTPNLNITNGNAEILGGFFYPIEPQFPGNSALYLKDSNLLATFMLYLGNQWPNLVTETQTQNGVGVTRSLTNANGVVFPAGTGSKAQTYLGMFYSGGYIAP